MFSTFSAFSSWRSWSICSQLRLWPELRGQAWILGSGKAARRVVRVVGPAARWLGRVVDPPREVERDRE